MCITKGLWYNIKSWQLKRGSDLINLPVEIPSQLAESAKTVAENRSTKIKKNKYNYAVHIQIKLSICIKKSLWWNIDRWKFKKGGYLINLPLNILDGKQCKWTMSIDGGAMRPMGVSGLFLSLGLWSFSLRLVTASGAAEFSALPRKSFLTIKWKVRKWKRFSFVQLSGIISL